MKIEIKNGKFYLSQIQAPKIKFQGKIFDSSAIYEICIKDLLEGKNIFIFLNENEDVFDENIEISNALYIKDDKYISYVYKTFKNNLVFYKNEEIKGNTYLKINKFKYDNNNIVLKYELKIANEWEKVKYLVLRERSTKEVINIPLTKEHIKIDIHKIKNIGMYDLFLNVEVDKEQEYILRIGKYRYLKAIFLKNKVFPYDDNNILIVAPYTTYKGNNLSFKVNIVKKEYYEYLLENNKQKDFWIIGEQGSKAQDNGYYFFKYLRQNHPEIKAYYIINKDSSDYKKVNELGNVIEFSSKEHFQAISRAKYFIGTHHIDYLFPIQDNKILKKNKAKKIFLQHGVMGIKYMANFYGNYANNDFYTDMFFVSSQREKEMIVKDFEYDENNVQITGLARFDNLFKEDEELKFELLIIPTWRDWLVNAINFEKTDYFLKYISLVEILKDKYDIKMVLHINMAQYLEYFKQLDIDVFIADEIDVQKFIKQAKVMITDYSSVSFDFSFLRKPVIYYQFDQEKFFSSEGSHLDIYKELPGEIVTSQGRVLQVLDKLKENNYKQDEKLEEKATRLIAYRDQKSCQRIYEEIRKNDYKNKKKFYKSKIFKRGLLRFRKSKYYYPIMKKVYNILKYLPKKNYVFIESNNGKGLVDSPKQLYLEWSKMYPKQKFIIIYNQNVFPMKYSHNAIGVRRLSISYFYYLARAKYWITNQNFPYYFKNHNTIYLQTWHGVPLKRMLNDLDIIVGRDVGYKKRVQTAIEQWTYILSTTPYTTKCFESAFLHKAKTLEVGFPRNDIYFENNELIKTTILEKYQIDSNKKVILFAPTFRDNGEKISGKYIQDLHLDYKIFFETLKGEFEFLIKLHPLAKNKNMIPDEYTTFFKIIEAKEDINNVMLITDILITDYSSVMFDYLLLPGKTILYAPDLEQYEFENRGFYLDYEKEAPGVVVKTQNELLLEISNNAISYNKEKYLNLYINQQEKVSRKIINIIKDS